MTERIIDFLDALVATVGAIDERYCLVEKREMPFNGQSTNIPYKYVGNGNYRPVEVDGGSVSYWRLVNNISFDVVDGNSAIKNLQATYPIRYVAMVKRDENNPLVFSQDVANILEGRNHDLQTQLQAKNVNITVGSIDTDTPKIWGEEFTMPIKEPDYKRSLIMLDITVTVIAKRECWQDCDNYPDILQGFPWCEDTAATLARLTDAQLDCISDELCGIADPVTEQVNGVTIGTSASGTTNNQIIENTASTPVGTSANPSVVADSRIGANGVYIIQTPAEVDATIDVHDTDGNDVGSDSGTTWEIADATVTINGSSLGTTGSVLAEGSVDIPVNLDGSPAGSWDGTAWQVTSAPCADATVNINGVFMDSIPSGGTENIEVRQEIGATVVGSKQGQYWRIDDSAISINGSPIADVPAEESLDITVQYENGTPVGTITGGVVEIPDVTPCPSVALALSDTTPDFGDTVTLTATATGFNGSIDYTFCVKNNLGGYTNIEQTDDNTYDWVAPYAGTYLIHVTAMDGSSNTAWACIEVTVTTFYVANSVDHAWNGDNRTLVSDHVDVLTDVGVTGGKNATAPSASDRCHLISNPTSSTGDMVSATVTNNAANRLQTTLSSYVDNITIYGAFSYSNNDVQGGFDGLVLLGGNGASVALGSRFNAFIFDNTISPRMFRVGLRNSANSFVGQSANLQLGINRFAYTYDNTTGDWEVIINGTTYTGNNAGGLRNVGTSNFTLLNGLAGTYALPFGEYMAELGICLSSKSSAELAKLYADILLRFPS